MATSTMITTTATSTPTTNTATTVNTSTDSTTKPRSTPKIKTEPTTFLSLALELRQQIYHHLFVTNSPINVWTVWFQNRPRRISSSTSPPTSTLPTTTSPLHNLTRSRPPTDPTGILRASKQISAEALTILYGANTFQFSIGHYGSFLSLGSIGKHNLQRIRHVKLKAWTRFHLYHWVGTYGDVSKLFLRDAKWDEEVFWRPLLTGLRSLEVVVLVPGWDGRLALPAPVGSLEPTLKVLGKWVGKSALGEVEGVAEEIGEREGLVVRVDDNECWPVKGMVDRWLAGRFVRIGTEEGDAYYRRCQAKRKGKGKENEL